MFSFIKSFKQYRLHESSLSRIWKHSQNRTIGIITAFRAEFKLPENRQRNRLLEMDIRNSVFGFIKVKGFSIEGKGTENERKVEEESFLLISEKIDNGQLKGFLRKMGKEYNQDNVLYKPGNSNPVILGTKDGVWPGLDVESPLKGWHANKIADYYSLFRGHRTFTFESVKEPFGLMTLGYMPKIDGFKRDEFGLKIGIKEED
jgi:hypothetical protein